MTKPSSWYSSFTYKPKGAILKQKRNARATKSLIFEACKRVLETKGSRGLTLDAVAEEAGLSKGGLLYHFPNKERLVQELFEHVIGYFDEQIERICEQEENAKGSYLRAYARGSIEQVLDPGIAKFLASLFASVDEFPWVHGFMQEKYVEWQAKIETAGVDPVKASLFRLTIDGMWFTEMFQYAPPSDERRTEVLNLLFDLVLNSKKEVDT